MSFKDTNFNDRRSAAATAKQSALEKFRAKIADPTLAERQAAHDAIAAARELRVAERKAAKEAEEAKLKAEAERLAIEQAEREEAERIEAEKKAAELKAAQKAARDARYAARKARR